MERSQQKYIRKVKLQLVQPKIKCSGRQDVSCYYNGKVVTETEDSLVIIIKVYGVDTDILYDKISKRVLTLGFTDLKLK